MRLQLIRWTRLLLTLVLTLLCPVSVPAAEAPHVDTQRANASTTVSREQIEQLPTGRTYRDVVDAARPYKENPKDSINWEALRGDQADAPIPGGVSMEEIQQSPVIYQREWPGEAMGMNGPILVEGKIGKQEAVGVYAPTGAPLYFGTLKQVKADPAPLQRALEDGFALGGGYSPDMATAARASKGGASGSATDANGNTVTVRKLPDGTKVRTVTTPDGRVIDSQPIEQPPVTKPKPREGGDSASTTDEHGNTVTIQQQPDGTKIKTVTAPDGTTLVSEPVTPPPVTTSKPRSGVSSASFVREDGLIETITLNKDGTRTRIVSTPEGRPIAADPLLPAEQAHQAAALAQQRQTAAQTGGPTLKPAKNKSERSAKKDGGTKDAAQPAAPPAPSPAVSDAPIESILDDLENPAGPRHAEPQGSPTTRETSDGTLVRAWPDGTTEHTSPDGGQFVRYGDDATFQRFPDGTTVQRNPDGAETHRNPDGTITKQTPPTVVNLGPGGKPATGEAAQYLQGQQPQTQNVAPGGGTQPPAPSTTNQPKAPEGQRQTSDFTPIIQSGYDIDAMMTRYQDVRHDAADGTPEVDWEALRRHARDFKYVGGGMTQIDPPAIANDLPAGANPAALDYGLGSKWGLGYNLSPKLNSGLNYNYDYAQATAPVESVLDDIGPESYKPGSGFYYVPGTDTALKVGGQSADRWEPQGGKMELGSRSRPGWAPGSYKYPLLPSYGKSLQPVKVVPGTHYKPFYGSHYFGKWEDEDRALMNDYYDDGGKGFPIRSDYHGVTFMEPPNFWQPNRIRMIQYGLPDEDGYRMIAESVLTIVNGKWTMDITYYEEDLIECTTQALPPNDPLYFKGEEAAANAARNAKAAKRPKLDMSMAAPPGMEGEGPAVLTRKEPVVKAVDQWGLRAVGYTPEQDSAWRIESGEQPNTIVAVIDSGLDAGHPDAPAHLWTNEDEVPGNNVDDDGNGYVDDVHGWNFVDDSADVSDRWGHGTLVAGIIAAKRDNGAGIAGINPGARIMVLKVTDDKGVSNSLALYRAIHYAADHGARVINISLGDQGRSRLVQLAVNYAHLRGCVVVVASGNANSDIGAYGPAGLRRVLTVGGLGFEGQRHALSNFGANTALLAPGEDIYSLHAQQADWNGPSGDRERLYRPATGTSFAAPIVAATASLMFAANPTRSSRDVEALLLNTAKDIDREGWDPMTGWGLLDARAALQADPSRGLIVLPTEVLVSRRGNKISSVEVYGVVAGALEHYEVSLGEGRNPSSWAPIARGTRTVQFGLLGHVDGEALKGGKTWTVRITAMDRQGGRRTADVPLTF